VCCYTTCQPEHGVADNMAGDQARLAVDSRAFPLLVFDPRKGTKVKERLTLQGKGRFAKHYDKDGNPSETLLIAKQDRLENWHLLQELAGLR
jgi:hypothetical protein